MRGGPIGSWRRPLHERRELTPGFSGEVDARCSSRAGEQGILRMQHVELSLALLGQPGSKAQGNTGGFGEIDSREDDVRGKHGAICLYLTR